MIQYLIAAIVDVLVGVVALRKHRTRSTVALALVAFSLALWSTELFLLTTVENLETLYPLFHLTRPGMFFIPPSFAFFCWSLLGGRSRMFLNLVVIPGVVASTSLSFFNVVVFPTELEPAQGGHLPALDGIYYAFIGSFLWCLLGSVVYSVASYKKVTHRERMRVKWLFITLVIVLVAGSLSIYLMNFNFYLSKMAGAAANIIAILTLLYATVQRNLMHVQLALSVGTIRLVVLALFAWFFFFSSEYLASGIGSVAGMLATLTCVVVMLESYPMALKWILPRIRKMISAERYNYDEVTDKARRAIAACGNFQDLVTLLDQLLYDEVGLKSYHLFIVEDRNTWPLASINRTTSSLGLDEPFVRALNGVPFHASMMHDELPPECRSKMAEAGAGACTTVAGNGRLAAVVLLGPTRRGFDYDYHDMCLFEWIAGELSQVLSRIRELDGFENELHEAKKRLSLLSMMNHYHHDIKAPLSVIDGVVSHQLYDSDTQRQVILEQVELGSRLITTMAGLLKGKRQRQVGPVALEQVLQDCVLIFRKMLDQVSIDMTPGTVIPGDADDLKIMFINLIKNAVEAAKPGSRVSINVKGWRENDLVKVSIMDDGIGMSPGMLEHLWEGTASSKARGNGIGLQAIKRIADEHHAEVEVVSHPGQGTEFVFSFPRVLESEYAAGVA